jgi:hypothetical protein
MDQEDVFPHIHKYKDLVFLICCCAQREGHFPFPNSGLAPFPALRSSSLRPCGWLSQRTRSPILLANMHSVTLRGQYYRAYLLGFLRKATSRRIGKSDFKQNWKSLDRISRHWV